MTICDIKAILFIKNHKHFIKSRQSELCSSETQVDSQQFQNFWDNSGPPVLHLWYDWGGLKLMIPGIRARLSTYVCVCVCAYAPHAAAKPNHRLTYHGAYSWLTLSLSRTHTRTDIIYITKNTWPFMGSVMFYSTRSPVSQMWKAAFFLWQCTEVSENMVF